MFRTVTLSIIRFSLYAQQWYKSYRFAYSKLSANLHVLLCVQWKTPDDGQRNCPKHVEFYSKNKFEKLVYLVGFIIRTYQLLVLTVLKYGSLNPWNPQGCPSLHRDCCSFKRMLNRSFFRNVYQSFDRMARDLRSVMHLCCCCLLLQSAVLHKRVSLISSLNIWNILTFFG